jgi:hypothetical protein
MSVIQLRVQGLPPAKSQRSVFGVRSKHYKRALVLLEEAHRVKSMHGFRGFGSARICLEVEVRAPAGQQPGDATNYLGGIADVLEVKKHRIKTSGPLDHLGYRKEVGLYDNDGQIKEIRYREFVSDEASYTVTVRALSTNELQ